MKQEDKELLLRDLCARLPYGVICTDSRHGDSRITEIDIVEETVYCDDFDECIKVNKIKPYLRPMSSMTDEEREEYKHLVAFSGSPEGAANFVDWLNAHHFDHRGLIEKGLAIEVTKGMYD